MAAAAGAGPEEDVEGPAKGGRDVGTTATGGVEGDVVGDGVGVGFGFGLGLGLGLGDGLGVGLGDGVGLGLGVGLAVAEGVGEAADVDCASAVWGRAIVSNPMAVATIAPRVLVALRDPHAAIYVQAGPSRACSPHSRAPRL